jgi:hypothetical protein
MSARRMAQNSVNGESVFLCFIYASEAKSGNTGLCPNFPKAYGTHTLLFGTNNPLVQ